MGRKQNPAYAELLRPDETDWRLLRDTGERRRIQNRLAQRAYRLNVKCRRLQLERLKQQLGEMQRVVDAQRQPGNTSTPVSPSNVLADSSRSVTSPTWLPSPSLSSGSQPLGEDSFCDFGHISPLQTPVVPDSPSFSAYSLPFSFGLETGLDCVQISGGDINGSLTNRPSGVSSQHRDKNNNNNENAPPRAIHSNPSLLHVAAENGHREVMQLLLARGGIDVNGRDMTGNTPLQLAVSAGKVEIVQLLLDHGANITL
ncbi:ankyrin repeats-domain-containing protein [Xylariales sp. AK1849]|nr:ankyrin repeats-domain-containing protein [Xylariales sp. AK1849]